MGTEKENSPIATKAVAASRLPGARRPDLMGLRVGLDYNEHGYSSRYRCLLKIPVAHNVRFRYAVS